MAQLIGRDREVNDLLGRLEHAVATRTSVTVALRGDPGIGKTRLLTHFSELAETRFAQSGILVGYGQAMMNSLGSDSFQAVRECLRGITLSAERSGSRDRLNRIAESFVRHAPDWAESVPMVGTLIAAGLRTGRDAVGPGRPDGPEMESQLDQLLHLVEDLLTRGPLLLVLDDLQWADIATVDLVMALSLRVRGPLMLVIAYRPGDLASGENGEPHSVRQLMFRIARYRDDLLEIDLHELSPAETGILVRETSGPVPEATIKRIIVLSAGNPLFAETLSRLGESLVPTDRQMSTPRQIKSVMEERLSHLTGEDQRLLETAALIGYSFEVDYLAQLARVDIDDLYERLDALLNEHGLIRLSNPRGRFSRYSIHHPLLAEVLRQRASSNAPRWRRLHERLLEILGDSSVWDDELLVRAVEIAVEAADDPRASELATEASVRQHGLGAFSKSKQLAEVAIARAGDSPHVMRAYDLLAKCLWVEGDFPGVVDASAQFMRWAQVHPIEPVQELSVKLVWAHALRMLNAWDECGSLLRQIRAAGTAAGLDEQVAQAEMLACEIALCGPDQDVDRAIELARAVSAATEDLVLQARAVSHEALAHLAGYRPAECESLLERAREISDASGDIHMDYLTLHWQSKKHMACLELDQALDRIRRIVEISESSGAISLSVVHLRDLSRTLGLRGDTGEAASVWVGYFDTLAESVLDRAVTTLALQLGELEELHGRPRADGLIAAIIAVLDDGRSLSDSTALLRDRLLVLASRPIGWEPLRFSTGVLGADPLAAEAAEALFRFDVPDLGRLRAGLG